MLDNLLIRLKAMHDEEGSVTAFKLPPPIIKISDIPLLYVVPAGFSESRVSGTTVSRDYRFIVEVLVLEINTETITSTGVSQGITSVATIMESMTTYYNQHRTLTTTTLGVLNNVDKGLILDAEGVVVPLIGHDGNAYIGTRFNLTVNTRIAIPLNP